MAFVFGITSTVGTIVLTLVLIAFFARLMFDSLKDRFDEINAFLFSLLAFFVLAGLLAGNAIVFFCCYYGLSDKCVNTTF